MSSDLGVVVGLALLAMLNPSLVAATAVMLLVPRSKSLMLSYLLGAYTTAITVGLVIVFTLQGSSFANTAKRTVSPSEQIAVGAILLLVAFILQTKRDAPARERRRRRKEAKARASKAREPWTERMLGRGSTAVAFAVGALLSFPGVSYLTALGRIAKVGLGTVPTVLLVVGFCLIQLIPLELPLLGYAFAPERTERAIASFRAWLVRRRRRVATIAALALGIILIVRGVVGAW
ncbi:MAG: GAP family protein [Solirubrobacteraceae bacterium]